MKNKTTAAILALLLGSIGIHRFYLGQGGLGVAYLLFCWTGIPWCIAVIDFVIFLTMSDAAFNAKYNGGATMGQQGGLHGNFHKNTADELEKLHDLKNKGVLSEEEFQARKDKLL